MLRRTATFGQGLVRLDIRQHATRHAEAVHAIVSHLGEGAYLDMALLDSQVAVLGYQAINYFVSGHPPSRLGNGHPNIVPYDVFPTSDGSVILAGSTGVSSHVPLTV